AAEDPRVQPARRRRVPPVRRDRPQGRDGRFGRRPGAAGDGDHRHRRRLLGHRAGRRAGVAAAPGDRRRQAAQRSAGAAGWRGSRALNTPGGFLLVLAVALPAAAVVAALACGGRWAERVVLMALSVGFGIAAAVAAAVWHARAPLQYLVG